MADPISVTATIITLATFIKDLIEVGQSIQRSIEKVGENRRRIRDLTNDILRTLADLANLTRGHEETFQAPALLTSLGNLKGHMLRVLEGCHQISPKRSPGFRGVKSQIKLWWNRDDIEAEIRRLKELANDCYVQFTVFSVARTELTTGRIENTTAQIEDTSRQAANTTLRVEQTLIVNNVENQVRLRRLEGMMARVFLQTQFGQNMMNETIEIIASDNKHRSLQFQYLAVEVTHLIDSVQCLLAGNDLDFEPPDWDPMDLSPIFLRSVSTKHILHTVLSLVLDIDERPAKLHMDSIIALDLGAQLATLGFDTEAMAWQAITVQILRQLAQIPGDHCLAVIPPLAFALEELSMQYSAQSQDERALQVSRQALDLYQFSLESSPEIDNRISYVSSLITHSRNLCRAKQALATISITQEAVVMCRPVLEQMLGKTFKSGSESFAEDEYKVVRSSDTFFALAAAFSAAARPREAYEASKDGLRFLLRFSRAGLISSPNPRHVDRFLDVLCEMAGDGNLTLGLLAHSVFLFRNLARIYPEDFSWRFLWLLYAYVYLCEQVSSSGLAHGLKNFRFFVNAKHRNFVQNLVPDTSSYFTRHIDNFDKHGGVTEDVIRAFFTSRHSRARDDEIFPFIRNIFFTHFDQASTALHDAITTLATATHIDSRALKRALEDIHSLLPSVSRSNQVQLLEIAAKITTHIRPASESMSPSESHIGWSAEELPQAYWSVRLVGPSGNALTSDEAIEYLARGSSKTEEKTPSGLRYWVICRALVLWETARLPEAIQAIQRVGKTLFPMPSPATPRGEVIELLVYSAIQIRILQRTGNYTEARRMLRLKVLFDTERIFPANDSEDQVLEFVFAFSVRSSHLSSYI
ncbi:hypothetical protein FB451DRAFT_58770 [Mycena latifolia]|nr:hypothetical protein FB451DRAFT_58770 [Mycena latifolia]